VKKVKQPVLDMSLLGAQFVNAIAQIVRRRTSELVAELGQKFNASATVRPSPLVALQEIL
jgi:hypothetical protein